MQNIDLLIYEGQALSLLKMYILRIVVTRMIRLMLLLQQIETDFNKICFPTSTLFTFQIFK